MKPYSTVKHLVVHETELMFRVARHVMWRRNGDVWLCQRTMQVYGEDFDRKARVRGSTLLFQPWTTTTTTVMPNTVTASSVHSFSTATTSTNIPVEQLASNNNRNYNDQPRRRTSVVEERVAASQFRAMEQMTQHLLDQKSFATLRIRNSEIQELYLYWLSKPVRDLCYKRQCPEITLQAANSILLWMMHQFDTAATEPDKRLAAGVIDYVLRKRGHEGGSVNAGVCRLMSLFSQPLQGTFAALGDHGRRTEDTAKQHIESLLAATRVYDIMERLHTDNEYFPNLLPDAQSYQSILNLYGKRCRFLVFLGPPPRDPGSHTPRIRRGVRWTCPDTVRALGGCTTALDCVVAAQELIQQMNDDPHRPNPVMIHYSILVSMMSYTACPETPMADEALKIARQLEDDPNFVAENSMAIHNAVLLAYVQEAAGYRQKGRWDRERESQNKCQALWEHIKQLDDTAMSADPITYSIMLKLYQDLDQASAAQKILDTMEADETNTPTPTLMHYNTVLNAWAKSSDADSGERAMTLLRRMEEQTTATGVPHSQVPRPDRISYTTALDALLRGSNFDDMMERMESVLERFEANTDVRRRPDIVTYNVLFHTLFRRLRGQTDLSAKVQVADKMVDFLRKLKKRSQHFRSVAAPRLFYYYNECLRAWVNTNSPCSAERATRLLQEMEEDSFGVRPNGTTYQNVLATISRTPDSAALKAARELFLKMEKSGIPCTVTALNTFLGMLMNCRFEGSIDEADDAFVEVILERFRVVRDDAFTYGWVFEGIFNHLNKESDTHKKEAIARRIEKLFRSLLQHSEHFRLQEGPHMTRYYNECLRAWAFARSPESTAHALRLLRELEEGSNEGSNVNDSTIVYLKPDTKTYEYILTCLTRRPDSISVHTARNIFRKMDTSRTPITLSVLNLFVRVLVKSGIEGSLYEAEQILQQVESEFLAGRDPLCPNETSYSVVLGGYIRIHDGLKDADRILQHMTTLSEKTGNAALLPSVDTYKSMIKLWSNSVASNAMERVDDLFQKMTAQSKPSSSDYAFLQVAWARSKRPDAPQHVESILVRMQEKYDEGENLLARPAVENFSIVIKTWAMSKQEGSAERADEILKRLEDLYYSDRVSNIDLRPNTICYENALLGWALSDSPNAGDRALALLDRMKQAQSADHAAAFTNQACYNYAILAIGKSDVTNKAGKCYDMMEEMRTSFETGQSRYGRPTHDSFLAVIRACATCIGSEEEREEAFLVTTKTMQEYLRFAHPSPRVDVYLQFLYAIFRLVPAGKVKDNAVRNAFVDEIFKCPSPIIASSTIRDALIKTVSSEVFADIVDQCGRQNLLSKLIKKTHK